MFYIKQKSLKQEIYRKAIHLSSLWIPLFICLAPQRWSLTLFGGGFLINVLVEYANYRRINWVRKIFARLFAKTLRPKEMAGGQFHPTGSMYVLAAAFLCALLFAKPLAAMAMTVMLVSDTAAALIGKIWGKNKIYQQKSWQGSAAFFLSAILVMLLFNPLFQFKFAAVIAAFAATLVELFEDKIKIDDNLSIPLIIGFILTIF